MFLRIHTGSVGKYVVHVVDYHSAVFLIFIFILMLEGREETRRGVQERDEAGAVRPVRAARVSDWNCAQEPDIVQAVPQ